MAAIDDHSFIKIFESVGPQETAKRLGIHIRKVYQRRENLERRHGIQITGPASTTRCHVSHPHRITESLRNGTILIGSDCHYWPGIVTDAHKTFVQFAKSLKPDFIVMNGDVLDGSRVSRHAPIGWENRPSLIDEVDACKERLGEIEKASPKSKRLWTLGNHDGRFETRLATVAPEYARINGVHLKDHFPGWKACWSFWLNDIVIKHRFRGGDHATWQNVMRSGKSIITGHLHSLQIRPYTDYLGTRFGIDGGTLADPEGPQFVDYTEDNPKNWRAGFVLLTIQDGQLAWPEAIWVVNGKYHWRGKICPI